MPVYLTPCFELCGKYRKCKLYRFDNDSGEWKERGVGQVRLLQSSNNGKIRLLMRQEKTLKIRANHFGKFSLLVAPGRHAVDKLLDKNAWHKSTGIVALVHNSAGSKLQSLAREVLLRK